MRIKKKLAAIGVVGLALISGGTAIAYWTTDGRGGSVVRTGGSDPVTVEQLNTLAQLAPGVAPQGIDIKLTNPSANATLRVAKVTAVVSGIELSPAAAPGSCTADDFTLTPEFAVAQEIPAGESRTFPAAFTISFNNKATVNQDGCKNAVVYLTYDAS